MNSIAIVIPWIILIGEQFLLRPGLVSRVLGGQQLKRGQMLMLSIAGANRDPAANENPDVFDITRENINHISFGHGIHLCLGISLARLEAKIALGKLFARYPNLVYRGGKADWGNSDFVRGLESLLVSSEQASIQPLARAANQ